MGAGRRGGRQSVILRANQQAGQESKAEDVRYLRAAAPELELKPDFVARYIIEREIRKRTAPAPSPALPLR